MIGPLSSLRPRPSLAWSVGVHAALGAVLWGSGLLALRELRSPGPPIVVGIAAPEERPRETEASEPETLELFEEEPLSEPDWPELVLPEQAPAEAGESRPAQVLEAKAVAARTLPAGRAPAEVVEPAPAQPPAEPSAAEPLATPASTASEQTEAVESPESVDDLQQESLDPEPLAHACPPPEYPASAARRRLQGTVELGIDVGADGRVTEVRILQSSGHDVLDQAARKAVLLWRYAPALEAGTPVARTVSKHIEFRIPKSAR